MTRVEELERELGSAPRLFTFGRKNGDGNVELTRRGDAPPGGVQWVVEKQEELIEALKEELRVCRGMRQVAEAKVAMVEAERDALAAKLQFIEEQSAAAFSDVKALRELLDATGHGMRNAEAVQCVREVIEEHAALRREVKGVEGTRAGWAQTETERDALAAKLREVEAQRDEWARQCNLASEAQADAISRLSEAEKDREHVYAEFSSAIARAERAEAERDEAIKRATEIHRRAQRLEGIEMRMSRVTANMAREYQRRKQMNWDWCQRGLAEARTRIAELEADGEAAVDRLNNRLANADGHIKELERAIEHCEADRDAAIARAEQAESERDIADKRARDTLAALEAERDAARAEERKAVVAWLRVVAQFTWLGPQGGLLVSSAADAIEAGEHLKGGAK